MTAKTAVTARITHRYTQSPERVFDAWLDRDKAGKFLFATPTGTMVTVEIDPRVGGKYRFVDRRDGIDIEHVGEYLEIERPRRLVFTLAVPKHSYEKTRVSIDIVPRADGCELTLVHEGVLPEYEEQTKTGWADILKGVARTIG
jgi:uncharacterized protein YndB with AHSA1/START domain